MNNKYIFLPVSFLILTSIVLLALEIPSFNLMVGSMSLFILALSVSLIITTLLFRKYHEGLDGQNRVSLIGNAILWSLIIVFPFVSIINRKYAADDCETASYKVVAYQGRYTAGYGNIEKDKIKANQWILKVLIDEEIEQFILEKDISLGNDVTRTMDLEFCNGIWGTKYLRIN